METQERKEETSDQMKNIAFLIKNPYGKKKTLTVVNKADSDLRFDCRIGCTLYGIKQKKSGGKGGTNRCIVTGLSERDITVVSFNLITGEKVLEATYPLEDVVIFPIPELHGLSEEEIAVLKGGAGFPDSITRENLAIGERRPEFVKNLRKFSPLVRTSREAEE